MKKTGAFLRMLISVMAGVMFGGLIYGIPVHAGEIEEQNNEYGQTQDYIDQWMESLDVEGMDAGMKGLFPELEVQTDELLQMILHGKITEALGGLGVQIKDSLMGKLWNVGQLFLYILILGVMSALFSGFSDLFAGKQIAQAGFYFLYLFLMVILTRVFSFVSEVAREAVENVVLFIKMFIPTYFVAVGTAQGTATAVFYYQMMLVVAYLVESFLNSVLIPFICSYVLLALLNGIWVEEKLSLLLDFIQKGIVMVLKFSMGAVTGLSLVQAVIVPVVDKLKISAVRKAVSAIPGIGGVAEGVTELMLGSAVLIKNSMGVLLMVLLLAACLAPIIQILAVTLTIKLGAALSGIVSDKRLSGCVDRVGEGCFLMLRCVFTSVALFFIVIAVVAYTTAS